MNTTLKTLGIIILALLLVAGGAVLGMMVASSSPAALAQPAIFAGGSGQGTPVGPGWMMGGYANGQGAYGGMMGGYGGPGGQSGYGGMMGGYYGGGNGGPGAMMMGGYVPDASLVPAQGQTLTMDQAKKVVEAYLKTYGDSNLGLTELIQFDNHFYAEIHEKDTGTGAFELLVDPVTAAVYPEPGPNMMWNTKYGMMGRRGMMGGHGGYSGMMSGWGGSVPSGAMTVTPEQARTLAQAYLDKALPGVKVSNEAETFYGYYTLDTERDGKTVGMLGVNGYTGAVWLHTWHGQFVAVTDVKD